MGGRAMGRSGRMGRGEAEALRVLVVRENSEEEKGRLVGIGQTR